MKTLTVKQPWASLICSGIKDIENRTWKTSFRGRILIQASAKPSMLHPISSILSKEQIDSIDKNSSEFNAMIFSSIIGSVEIIDCRINYPSIWAEKSRWYGQNISASHGCKHSDFPDDNPIYNWVLTNPIMFAEPIPCKGKLSLWDYPITEEELSNLKIVNK